MLHQFPLRAPKPLVEVLADLAHARRTSTNKLIVQILEEYVAENAIGIRNRIYEREQQR